MNKTKNIFFATIIMLAMGCTNMNPEVKFDPKTDAEAYCAIGKKDSKTATKFWDKVETAYIDNMMFNELEEFENIIVAKSQTAAQEYPVRVALRSQDIKEGDVSYYPDQDAQTYLDLLTTDNKKAEEFYNKVIEDYNTDGMYEDLDIFHELCGTK